MNPREREILETVREGLRQRIGQLGLVNSPVEACGETAPPDDDSTARARILTTEEAIGEPRHDDYPLLGGRERLLEVSLGEGRGVAYTDAAADWQGTATQLCDLDLQLPLHRALLVAGLNAVMAATGEIKRTLHCRGEEPEECAARLPGSLSDFTNGVKPLLLIGFQPRFVDALTATCIPFRIIDRNPDLIGKTIGGTRVEGPDAFARAMDWAELVLATGSVFANGTAHTVLDGGRPLVIYGVTGAGPARLLNLPRYCMGF